MPQVRKIAFEEHYTAPGFAEYSKAFVQHIPPALASLRSNVRRIDGAEKLREVLDGLVR